MPAPEIIKQLVERFEQHYESYRSSKYADKVRHDKMVSLVKRMLSMHKNRASTKNPQEADRLTREVEATDRAIDQLVYELYGLTEDEVKIVVGAS